MIEWKIEKTPVSYETAQETMEKRVDDILAGRAPELVWLVEHPPLYTAGTSAKREDLLTPDAFPVYEAGRGGQFTYHGPGQRVAYVMLDLKKRGAMDVRAYVQSLERWLVATLAEFGVEGFVREGRVGVWVEGGARYSVLGKHNASPSTEYQSPSTESKIAAIGIRIRKWVTYHGVCLNVNPNLAHYAGIVPCGIAQFGVTSLEKLGVKATMDDVDAALQKHFSAEIDPEMNDR